MNKKYIFLIFIIIAIMIGGGFYLYESSKNNSTNLSNVNTTYDASKASSNESKEYTIIDQSKIENTSTNSTNNTQNTTNQNNIEKPTTTTEKEIAQYTSKIRTKDSDRQNNITVACSTLNDTIVENGSTFSFCNTLGKTSDNKGYEKAKVFQDGKEVEAMGGGICQVSSTLYNAVLKISDIKITERHSHSGEVYYVPKGKDAAVAYGSYDFKFVNNTGKSLKIKAENTENNVTIKILKLE